MIMTWVVMRKTNRFCIKIINIILQIIFISWWSFDIVEFVEYSRKIQLGYILRKLQKKNNNGQQQSALCYRIKTKKDVYTILFIDYWQVDHHDSTLYFVCMLQNRASRAIKFMQFYRIILLNNYIKSWRTMHAKELKFCTRMENCSSESGLHLLSIVEILQNFTFLAFYSVQKKTK